MIQFFYFAYGSNMAVEQMKRRCPDAEVIGPATLPGYSLQERRFADIDKDPGDTVHGLLWKISARDLTRLDRYEGFPDLYGRHTVRVHIRGKLQQQALVYEMTPEAKKARDGEMFPEYYRKLCSDAADTAGIKNMFRYWLMMK